MFSTLVLKLRYQSYLRHRNAPVGRPLDPTASARTHSIVNSPLTLGELGASWRMHDEAPLPELNDADRAARAAVAELVAHLKGKARSDAYRELLPRATAYYRQVEDPVTCLAYYPDESMAVIVQECAVDLAPGQADVKPFEEPRLLGLPSHDLEALATQLTGIPAEPLTCVDEFDAAQADAVARWEHPGLPEAPVVAKPKARHARVVVDLTHNLVSLQVRTVREDRIAWVTRWRKTAAGAKAARELAEAWTAKLAERNWRVWETRYFYARERLTVIQAGRTVRVREDREGGAVKYDRRCTSITEARALLTKLQTRLDAAGIAYRTYQPKPTHQEVAA